jgi:acylphosphatase
MAKIHRQIIVKGKVQGVYFRASTKQAAEQLRVTGQVKNLPDGSVWIAAEGEEPAMEKFIAWCRQGPPHAVVSNLQLTAAPLQHFTAFEIIR